MMLFSLLTAFISLSVSDTDPDVLFSKHQALRPYLDTVEIWLKATWKDGELAAPQYVLRRTVSYRPDVFPAAKWQTRKMVMWASDDTCPQALKLLESLTKVQVPAIKIAEMPSDNDYAITVRADGAQYRLVVPGYYPGQPGKIDVAFGVDTPIANWIDEGFRAVAPCWQSQRPKTAE